MTNNIFPTENMTLAQKRRCGKKFSSEVMKNAISILRQNGWRKKSAWFFKAEQGWYYSAFVTAGYAAQYNELRINSALTIKPLAVDIINWSVTGLEANADMPLSFRSNGAFTLSGLPITKGLVDIEHDKIGVSAKALANYIIEQEAFANNVIENKLFSDLVRTYNEDQDDRFKQQALYWTALISEGSGERALTIIREHYLGKKIESPNSLKRASDIVKKYENYIIGSSSCIQRKSIEDLDLNLLPEALAKVISAIDNGVVPDYEIIKNMRDFSAQSEGRPEILLGLSYLHIGVVESGVYIDDLEEDLNYAKKFYDDYISLESTISTALTTLLDKKISRLDDKLRIFNNM